MMKAKAKAKGIEMFHKFHYLLKLLTGSITVFSFFLPKICEDSQFIQDHVKTQGRQDLPHSFLFVSISFPSIPIPFKNNLVLLSWNTLIYIHVYIYRYIYTYVVLVLVLQFQFESHQLHFPWKSCIQTQVTKSICLLRANNHDLLTEDWKPLSKLTYWKYFRAYFSEELQASK